MTLAHIKALTFDTGGTVLDWHSGFAEAFETVGAKYGFARNWKDLANELRRRSLDLILAVAPDDMQTYTFDNAHREALDHLLFEHGLGIFTAEDRHYIAYEAVHSFNCWAGFAQAHRELRAKYLMCPLTVLSYRIVIDTARHNNIHWDAIFPCEAIGAYKPNPEVYRRGAQFLQLDPSEILMVACHNFDLNAAKEQGFKTAFVHRPQEWGHQTAPTLDPVTDHDLIVDDFAALKTALL